VTWVGNYEFDDPFEDVRDSPKLVGALTAELDCELAPGHMLHGTEWTIVARALPQDDVIVATESHVALVHLTWAGREEHPPWPQCHVLGSAGEFEEFTRYRY
jgi:hypothetical protein